MKIKIIGIGKNLGYGGAINFVVIPCRYNLFYLQTLTLKF